MQAHDTEMTRHSWLIAERQRRDPAWQQHGFRRAAMALVSRIDAAMAEKDRMPDLVASISDRARFVPDLFCVTADPPGIAICEVECSHRVPEHKRHHIGELGDLLVELGIELRVLIIDAHGSETEINWQDWHLDLIRWFAEQAEKEAEPAIRPPPDPAPRVLPSSGRPRMRQPGRSLDEIIDAAIARRAAKRARRE